MKEKGCFISIESVGKIINSKEGKMIGTANHDGGYDYTVEKPVSIPSPTTVTEKLIAVRNSCMPKNY